MTRAISTPTHRKKVDLQAREQWIADLTSMAEDVARWSDKNDWTVKWETKRIAEDEIGVYNAPALIIQTAQGRLYFTPIARYFYGDTTGRIEISGPTFAQIILLRKGHTWKFFSDDMVNLRKAWSQTSFNQIARDLLNRP
jgi:hypothetical protein